MSDEQARLFLRDEAHRAALARGETPPISPLSWWDLLFAGMASSMFVLSGLLMASMGALALYTGTQEGGAGGLPAEGRCSRASCCRWLAWPS